jgi:transcriptional regulator with XRE-family HTH domain
MGRVGPSSFGELLRRYRTAARLTQEELAERAGLSARGVQDLERSVRRSPHSDTTRRLAEALGLGDAERATLLTASNRAGPSGDSAEAPRPAPGLPIPLTRFVGRQAELAEIHRLFTTIRLLTLTGAGGMGKTRLALEAARRLAGDYPNGAELVELAGLANPELVPQTVATVLGIVEQPKRVLLDVVADALRTRRLLLVLDNCEHVIVACAELAKRLLQACPELHILATSREPLGIAGESIWRVPSLSLPAGEEVTSFDHIAQAEAVQLFAERAASVLPSFALTERNAPAVAQLCRRLDGIPLALELAAARATVLSVEQLAERLDDALRLLTAGSRTAPARQQTLRATLDWSYSLLTDLERRLFVRLAVFSGAGHSKPRRRSARARASNTSRSWSYSRGWWTNRWWWWTAALTEAPATGCWSRSASTLRSASQGTCWQR